MSNFKPILTELIKTGIVISHYPQFNRFEVLDKNDNRLVGLYTQKSSTDLARQYKFPVNTYIRNRYYKFELKLKIKFYESKSRKTS